MGKEGDAQQPPQPKCARLSGSGMRLLHVPRGR